MCGAALSATTRCEVQAVVTALTWIAHIINSTYVTLDGVIGNVQDWPSVDSDDDTGTRLQTELLLACDAVLLGRATYDSFASVWEGKSGDPYTDQMNSMEKYVVSSKLNAPSWNNTNVISGDVIEEVARLKELPGGDILQYGFGPLAHTLMEHGLLDEVRVWVHPFFFGNAGPDDLLFRNGPLTRLTLTDTTTLTSGIIILTYQVNRT